MQWNVNALVIFFATTNDFSKQQKKYSIKYQLLVFCWAEVGMGK
jgi:hypothetical protein